MVNKDPIANRPEKIYDVEVVDQIHRHYTTTACTRREAEEKVENMIQSVDYRSNLDKLSTSSELRFRNCNAKTFATANIPVEVESNVTINLCLKMDPVAVNVSGNDGYEEIQGIVDQLADCFTEKPESLNVWLFPNIRFEYRSDEYRNVDGSNVNVCNPKTKIATYEAIAKALFRYAEQEKEKLNQDKSENNNDEK